MKHGGCVRHLRCVVHIVLFLVFVLLETFKISERFDQILYQLMSQFMAQVDIFCEPTEK